MSRSKLVGMAILLSTVGGVAIQAQAGMRLHYKSDAAYLNNDYVAGYKERTGVLVGQFPQADPSKPKSNGLGYEPLKNAQGNVIYSASSGSSVHIGQGWLLTAAHVVANAQSGSLKFYNHDNIGSNKTPVSISQAWVHAGYDGRTGSPYDLALVKLTAKPATLASVSRFLDTSELDRVVTFGGYGRTGGWTMGAGSGSVDFGHIEMARWQKWMETV